MKVLFHVQHLLGIGHHRRAEILARTLAANGLDLVVAAGGAAVTGEDWGKARVSRLPLAGIGGRDFRQLLDAGGRPIDEAWRTARRDRLLDLAREERPNLILLEGFPFARRQFRFELLPLLDWAAAQTPRPLVATSIRDILVAKPDPKRVAEVIDLVRTRIDHVLVHGDPSLITLDATFPGGASIADKIAYTGFVVPEAPVPRAGARTRVVVSAGGGAVGFDLLAAACQAARPGHHWHFITGPMMPDAQVDALRGMAPADAEFDRHRTDFHQLLNEAVLSISQAGYNTVLDILRCGPRAILVPFAAPGETEQTLRANLLSQAGRAISLAEVDLSPTTLSEAIDRALAAPPPPDMAVALDGAANTARLIKAWL